MSWFWRSCLALMTRSQSLAPSVSMGSMVSGRGGLNLGGGEGEVCVRERRRKEQRNWKEGDKREEGGRRSKRERKRDKDVCERGRETKMCVREEERQRCV